MLITTYLLIVCVSLCLCATPDYSYDFNMSESDGPPTTYLPEVFTYLPSQVCPERLPSMSKCRACRNSRLAVTSQLRVRGRWDHWLTLVYL